MSLLTSDDPKKATHLIKQVANFCSLLSFISFLAGFGYFAFLIQQPDKTYFSDNALLPGLASREFTYSKLAENYLNDLENITHNLPENTVPVDYLLRQFSKIGLPTYEHRFQLHYPFGHKRIVHHGRNVYAIFRAPRTSSTEAIVISAPYRSKTNVHGSTLPSISLMLTLAKFFSTKMYWAKDIIFLISDKELVGMQAWLNSYHGLKNENHVIKSESLLATSGVIQAALNLEIHSFQPKSMDIKIEGINGQLPNLDLFNVAVELCVREGVPVTFHGNSFYMSTDEWEKWMENAKTIGSMMMTQATTLPTGAHALFQKFAIQSLTLETTGGVSKKSAHLSSISQLNLGRSIEGIVRSLNNMLERFNRSYYFYLLPSTRRYISIGFYMISFGLLALPLALRALYLYFRMLDVPVAKQDRSKQTNSFNLWSSFQPNFIAHLCGIVMLAVVPLVLCRLDQFSRLFGESSYIKTISVNDLAYSIFVTLALVSLFPQGILNQTKTMSQFHLQSMVALLNALLLFVCISLVNISLALGLTVIYVPVVCWILLEYPSRSSTNGFFRLLANIKLVTHYILLILIHPITLHLLCLTILSLSVDPELKFNKNNWLQQLDWKQLTVKHLRRSFQSQRKIILYYIEDWYLFDNWSFPLVSLFLYPVWLQFWYISVTKIIPN